MDKLKFYDVVAKKSFETSEYQIINKGGRTFAVAESRDGNKAWRVIKKQ